MCMCVCVCVCVHVHVHVCVCVCACVCMYCVASLNIAGWLIYLYPVPSTLHFPVSVYVQVVKFIFHMSISPS